MTLKITDETLCIPPFISTSWDKISWLESEESGADQKMTLILHLTNDQVVKIPNLDSSVIEQIFVFHQKFLERQETPTANKTPSPHTPSPQIQNLMGLNPEQLAAFQMRLGPNGPGNIAGGLEGLESTLQHNPSQAKLPDLPEEMVQKIAAIARIVTNGDLAAFPKPEPHCNCMHCQVARAIHNPSEESAKEDSQEPISDEDLKFRDWEITQENENLYTVTNPLDKHEQYSVFLGTPVGCTCGKPHCEHIKAVLLT